jgi:eukaryotic-like serine/threonine-protein kinase
MSDEMYLDERRDPLAESGTRAARVVGGVDEHESAPAPNAPMGGRELGSIVANRYVLKAHLGSGRYGEIFAAVDRSLSDPQLHLEHRVALHFLHRRISEQTQLLRKLESGYQQTHLWAHPNVVKVGGFGCDRGQYFLVMELLEGMSLRALLEARSEPPSDTETSAVLRGVGDALKYAHAKGSIHGDIRPEKIFIAKGFAVKVLDLLPASSPRTGPFFVEDAAIGMPVAPDVRDDVYGLACVAYELLAGRHPFDGRSPLEAWDAGLTVPPIPRLGARQWEAFKRGLALRREHRTPDVATFVAEFGVSGRETLAAAEKARPTASASVQSSHARNDDLPILGDHSGDWDVGALRARSGVRKPQRATHRTSDAPRVHPEDVRRHRELARLREPRGIGLGLVSVVLVAAAAVAVYLNYEPLRGHAAEWLAKLLVLIPG